MKKKILAVLLVLGVSSQLSATNQKMIDLVDNKCGTCHLSGILSKEKLKRMAAPPMWGVSKKIKTNIASREDQIKFMMDFALNPTKEKMMFPQETIDRFGYMTSQKGKVTEEELRAIAEYLLSK